MRTDWHQDEWTQVHSMILPMLTMVTEIVANLKNRNPISKASKEDVYGEAKIRLTLNCQTGHCKVDVKIDDCFTAVFDCCRNGYATICRPGKWCNHVDELYAKVQRRLREYQNSPSGTPIVTRDKMEFSGTDEVKNAFVNFRPISDWATNYNC